MVLVDQHVHSQPDVLAADRVGVSLDAKDTVRLYRHHHRCVGLQTLGWKWLNAAAFR